MKCLFLLTLSILLFSSAVSGQTSLADELTALNNQIAPLAEQGQIDKVIEIAEKIAEIERLGGVGNRERYASALLNLAIWKKLWIDRNQSDIQRSTDISTRRKFYTRATEAADGFEKLVQIYTKEINDPPSLDSARSELASIILSFGRTTDDLNRAKELLLRSIEYRAATKGENAESTLSSRLRLMDLFLVSGDLENLIRECEVYLTAATSAYGERSRRLLAPLRLYSFVLNTLCRESERTKTNERIALITGTEEPNVRSNYPLVIRAAKPLDLTIGTNSRITDSDTSQPYIPNPMSSVNSILFNGAKGPVVSAGSVRSPAIATPRGTQNSIQIIVFLEIGENGEVLKAEPQHDNDKVRNETIKLSQKWRFKPFSHKGINGKMYGMVVVEYFSTIPKATAEKK